MREETGPMQPRNVDGFFGVAQRGGRWTFVDGAGEDFFSIGVNHADESNLKYPENIEIWRTRYGSRDAWIRKGVVRDLDAWGFNTIGWTSECVAFAETTLNDYSTEYDTRHSQQWGIRDFAVAGMPYCIAVPVAPIEGWNLNPVYPDVFSAEWQQWCDYLGRSLAAEYADDPNLIGYFFVDIPAWRPHPSGRYFPGLEPGDEAGLSAVARRYYQSIHDAIRVYDENHLILGDRYNGNLEVPAVVLDAMAEYVDVLSVQYFPGASPEGRSRMREDLSQWHARTGRPVLIADIGNWCSTAHNPQRTSELDTQSARADDYIAAFESVVDEPWLVGWHWCSYSENHVRGWGLKDPDDNPYDELLVPVTEFNRVVSDRRARRRG